MSIESQIDRINANVQDTINTIQSTGVTVPPGANSDNLPGLAAALANEKQDKLTGQQGQVVGFDAEGNAVAQSPASSGVTSFEGRTGTVTAQQGDYTAAMVGAVPTTRKVNGKALSADVEIGAGDVSYDNSETSAIITGDNVQSAIDQLFTSVSNGKSLIAGAITDKGVSTSASDSFQQMASNIGQIEMGGGSCTGSMQFAPKNGVKYIYIDGNGGPKSSITATIDSVAIGSFLVVVFASQLSSLTISGGLRYVTDITYDDVSTMGNVYMVTGDFSIY